MDEDRKEEYRKWLAELLKAKLDSMKLHPPKYRPGLSQTLELQNRKKVN